MTTVAHKAGVMAADRLGQNGGLMHDVEKIHFGSFSGGERFVLGCAGDRAHSFRLLGLLEERGQKYVLAPSYFDEYNSDTFAPAAILVTRINGRERAFMFAGGVFLPLSRLYHAIGSGRDYAIAAMHLGKDAIGAVEVAEQFDPDTRGLSSVDCETALK